MEALKDQERQIWCFIQGNKNWTEKYRNKTLEAMSRDVTGGAKRVRESFVINRQPAKTELPTVFVNLTL